MNKSKRFSQYLYYLIFTILFIVIILFFTYPLSYEVYLPGGVDPISPIVSIDGAYETGDFNSSYVSVVTRPTPFQYLYGYFNKQADIRKLSAFESKLSTQEMNDSNRIEKNNSIYDALIVAYTKANKELTYQNDGAIIAYRYVEYASTNEFLVGDIITKVNDTEIKTVTDLSNSLATISCDKSVKIDVLRGDYINNKDFTTLHLDITRSTLTDSSGNTSCIFGLVLDNYIDNFESNPTFTVIDNGGYGSSAGLLQALAFYNQLVPEEITHRLKIAGTGVISREGNVLPIAGMKQKMEGAIKDHVDLFFAPDMMADSNGDGTEENLYQVALDTKALMKSDIIIVPVKTFDDALTYLLNYDAS